MSVVVKLALGTPTNLFFHWLGLVAFYFFMFPLCFSYFSCFSCFRVGWLGGGNLGDLGWSGGDEGRLHLLLPSLRLVHS